MGKDMFIYVVVLLALLVFAALAAISVHSNGLAAGRANRISVTASGTVSNVSAEALLYVTMNATGATNGAAVNNLTSTLNSFNSTISGYIGGNSSKVTTQSFQVYKLYNRSGYQATEIVQVMVPSIRNTGSVIGALSSIPNTYVTGAYPKLSDAQMSLMRKQALALALGNATSQARALIGNSAIISRNITINSYYVLPYSYGVTSSAAIPGTVTVTPQFYGGTNRVTESITVVFTYQN